MLRVLFLVFMISSFQNVSGISNLCSNMTTGKKTLSCTTQILGNNIEDNDICNMEVFPADSQACGNMSFSPMTSTGCIGGVTLKPYIMTLKHEGRDIITPYDINHTVLNINFSNIKWKSMRFRFQDKNKYSRNHCRVINISKDIAEQSVLYYDCYWTTTDDRVGQSHILDFAAEYDNGDIYTGQYHFNIPTAEMLSPVAREEEWKPFIYVEKFPSRLRLHMLPPPSTLEINAYHITVMAQDDTCPDKTCKLQTEIVNLTNATDDVTYDYNIGQNGLYYFAVMPMHKSCVLGDKCRIIESPKVVITDQNKNLNICIASVIALIFSVIFVTYHVLKYVRKRWCKDYKPTSTSEIPPPTKVLVVYSPVNTVHAKCVVSFVTYLRSECGFDVMFDGDISNTSHGDPCIWAEEAFSLASHVMYIVGPAEHKNVYTNIYEKPIITAYRDVDALLLTIIKSSRAKRPQKEVFNVFFEHSNGQIPIETKHDRAFYLFKDWHKLVSYLSNNMLPRQMITRTERGRCFMDELNRAGKLLSGTQDEVIVRCDKINTDKKILL